MMRGIVALSYAIVLIVVLCIAAPFAHGQEAPRCVSVQQEVGSYKIIHTFEGMEFYMVAAAFYEWHHVDVTGYGDALYLISTDDQNVLGMVWTREGCVSAHGSITTEHAEEFAQWVRSHKR